MSKAIHYARLVKVDEAARKVYGVAVAEEEDRARETFDYESSKPYFEQWSSDVAKASGGKSLGNVRAMHGNIAAGRLTELGFNDAEKAITIEVDVVDDGEWKKVLTGVYTGFSMGGKYIRKWTDSEGRKRYTARPSEISLVDLPCVKSATFELVKADGAKVEEHFDDAVTADEAAVTEALTKAIGADDAAFQKDALKLDDDGNLFKFDGEDWQPHGKVVKTEEIEALQKGAYSIGRIACLAEDVQSFLNYRMYETAMPGEPATIPDALRSAASALYDALLAIVNEDAAKAKEQLATKAAEARAIGEEDTDLRKRYDALAALEGSISELAKGLGMDGSDKFIEAVTKLATDHNKLREEHADLQKRYDELPAPGKGVLRVVEKAATVGDDAGDQSNSKTNTSAELTPEDVTKAAFASALRKGRPISDINEVRKA